jgi:glyoxylate reductase
MKILITKKIDEGALKLLKGFEVDYNDSGRPLDRDELVERIKDAHAVLSVPADNLRKEVLEKAENLKIIAQKATGYDNIDVEFATRRGIMVTNTPDTPTEATADLTFGLMIACARKIAIGDRYLREGREEAWQEDIFMGKDIYGSTLGIVGFGRIGRAVARRAKGFNMKVIHYSRRSDESGFVEFDELLEISDFISVHVPLTKETYHMFSRKEFEKMKSDAIFVNTSRGKVVDERALVEALKKRRIGGAALDVFEFEPEISEELKEMDNVVITPHIGTASEKAEREMARCAVENLLIGLKGMTPPNIVNREVIKDEEDKN